MTKTEGVVKSPGYPNYKDGLSCSWLISVSKGMVIHLKTIFFRIERSYNCERDALYIYDGPSINSRLYSKPYCDNKGPGYVESSENTLFLKFITDDSISNKGFQIEYKAKKGKLICRIKYFSGQKSWKDLTR